MKLYKYYSLATKEQMGYVQRAIVNREIHCGDPGTFNDPFDCNIAVHLKRYIKKLGVACLSGEKADHVLMFSHYGDRHRGIALVFDVVDDGPIGDLTFLGRGQYVNYVEHDRLPDLMKCSDSSRAREVVLTKWKKWNYENEYRVFANLVECDSSRIWHYEVGELVGVILGLHTPDDDKQNIEGWLRRGQHSNVWQKQAQLSSDSFTLAFV